MGLRSYSTRPKHLLAVIEVAKLLIEERPKLAMGAFSSELKELFGNTVLKDVEDKVWSLLAELTGVSVIPIESLRKSWGNQKKNLQLTMMPADFYDARDSIRS
eukprot:TRINITY_DN4057_c0_g1_i1.p1 TRINITY_DN4057_c0_g1~~TRINITY_DN4057_c0_g1_i1.p1  ORF type:complete len:103 (-),score=23.87 TRINITY_DN4057_c0_g1_i1:75-383(-)